MAYRYQLTQSFEEGTRRIALEQISLAKRDLRGDQDLKAGVWRARKNVKRLRALLRLIQPSVKPSFFRKQDLRLRSVARRLGKARDIHAKLETLTGLENRYSVLDDRQGLRVIRAELERRKELAESKLTDGVLADAVATLMKAESKFQTIELGGRGFEIVAPGLETIYATGVKRLNQANKHRTSYAYHELRKAVQYHWRHMQLLNEAWRDDGDARVAAARELSGVLGDDHDIAVLLDYVSAQLGDFSSKRERKMFFKLCASAQVELRAHARPLARRLFAETPDAFALRMAAYWKSARDLQAMNVATNPVKAEAQILAMRGKR